MHINHACSWIYKYIQGIYRTVRLFLLRRAILELCTGQIIRSLKRNTSSYRIRTFCVLLALSLEGTKNGTWLFCTCTLRFHCTPTHCSWLTHNAGKRIVIAKKKKKKKRLVLYPSVYSGKVFLTWLRQVWCPGKTLHEAKIP